MPKRIDPQTGRQDYFQKGSTGSGSGTVTSVAGGVGLTGTPADPIVAAGTLDLDIFSLTTEPAPAAGDWFAFVDISVGTTPSSQRKVALSNLASVIGGLIGSVTGPAGPTGPPGMDGADGEPGDPGPPGLIGLQGLQGLQGIPGLDGEDGLDSFVPGPQGLTGAGGAPGSTGATGPTGLPGAPGMDGEDGADSFVPGPIGPRGLAGIQGIPGLDGEDGLDSFVPGPAGPQGATGASGGTGSTGPAGSAGLPGMPGLDAETSDDWAWPMPTTVDTSMIISGLLPLARGGTGADLSGTGPGFVKQAGFGNPFTVAFLGISDIPQHDLLSTTHSGTIPGTPAAGDMIFANSAGPSWTRRAIGVLGTVLTSTGIAPAWSVLDARLIGTPRMLTLESDGDDNTDMFVMPGPPGPAGPQGATGPPGSSGSGGTSATWFPLDTDGDSGEPWMIGPPDLSQYFFLPGRPGGQIGNGGVNASDILTFRSTTSATKGTVDLDDKTRLWPSMPAQAAQTANILSFAPTVALSGFVNTIHVVDASPLFTINSGVTIYQMIAGGQIITDKSGLNSVQLFSNNGTFQGDTAGTVTLSGGGTFIDQSILQWRSPSNAAGPTPKFASFQSSTKKRLTSTGTWTVTDDVTLDMIDVIGPSGAATQTMTRSTGVFDERTFQATGGAGSILNIPDLTTLDSNLSFAAGVSAQVNATTRRGVRVRDVTFVVGGTNAITTNIGVDVENLVNGGTNLSLRSLGAAVQMRHAGPAVFGANAAPTNASSGLELQSTTLDFLPSVLTTTQETTLTGVAVADGMLHYNSTLKAHRFRENGAWLNLPQTGSAQVDFGFASAEEGDTATATVTGQAWVSATSKILASVLADAATADHDPDDAAIEEIQVTAQNIVAGTGFDLVAYAPEGTWGRYSAQWVGA